MRFFRNKDAVSGLFLTVFSVWALYSTSAFASSSISAYGNPAVVPRITILIILVLSVLILSDGVRAMRGQATAGEAGCKKQTFLKEQLPEILTFLLLAVYVILIKPVGFVITTAVYLGLQMYILSCFDRKKIWLFALIACVISPALYYGFRTCFDVLLPAGILNWNP